MPESNKGCRVFWTYMNRFTEANAGGGTNTVKITPAANTAIRLVSLKMTMADTAAGRTATIGALDEDGSYSSVWGSASLDNQYLNFPAPGTTAATASNHTTTADIIIVGDGSCVSCVGAALANTEYFDVGCTFELFGTATAPTVAHTSSGTASTGTASQNEVTVVPVFA